VPAELHHELPTAKEGISRSQWPLACWGCDFESHLVYGCLSVV